MVLLQEQVFKGGGEAYWEECRGWKTRLGGRRRVALRKLEVTRGSAGDEMLISGGKIFGKMRDCYCRKYWLGSEHGNKDAGANRTYLKLCAQLTRKYWFRGEPGNKDGGANGTIVKFRAWPARKYWLGSEPGNNDGGANGTTIKFGAQSAGKYWLRSEHGNLDAGANETFVRLHAQSAG